MNMAGIDFVVDEMVPPNEVWLVRPAGHTRKQQWDGERLTITVQQTYRRVARITNAV